MTRKQQYANGAACFSYRKGRKCLRESAGKMWRLSQHKAAAAADGKRISETCLNRRRSRLMFFSSLNCSCVCVCVCRCNTIAYYLNASTYSVTPYPRPGRCWRCGCDCDCDHCRTQGGGVELFSWPLRAITPSRMAAFLLLFLEVEIRQFRTCAALPSPHHAAISPPSPHLVQSPN